MRARLGFSSKILLMPALAGLSFVVVLLVNDQSSRRGERLMAQMRDRHAPAVALAGDIDDDILAIQDALQGAVAGAETEDLDRADAATRRLGDRLRAARHEGVIDASDLESVEGALKAYYAVARNVGARMIGGEHGDSLESALQELERRQADLRRCAEDFAVRQQRAMDLAFQTARAEHTASLRIMTAVVLVSLGVLVVLSGLVVRSTTSGLRQAVRAAEGLARGELDTPIGTGPPDEVGQLLTAMQATMAYLREMAATADRIAGGDLDVKPGARAAGDRFGNAFRKMVEAEVRYKHIVESVEAIVWHGSARGSRLTFVSREIEKILGYPVDRWTGDESFWRERIHPEDREQVLAATREAIRNGGDLKGEYRMIAADGRTVWLQGSARVIFADGGPHEIVGVMVDITERKRAEHALAEGERRLSEAQRLAHLGSWEWDVTANRLAWSDELCRIYGREDRPPVRFEGFLALVHPEDRPAVARVIEAMREGGSLCLDHRIIRPDGAVRTMHTVASVVFDEARRPARVVGTSQDVTELKQAEAAARESEERYRTLFEDNPQPLWVYDVDSLRFLAVNDAALQHYGYSGAEFLSMTIADIRLPEEVDKVRRAVATASQGVEKSGVWRHRRKDGSLIDVEISSHAVAFGEWRARLVLANDVTDRKRLEDQLRQSQKMEAIGQLAGGVAHDFNNILNVIMGYGQMMQRHIPEGQRLRRHVDEILKASDRAAGLTRQLLAFSRKQVLQPKVLDLKVVVGDMEKMLQRLIGEDIQLATSSSEALGYVKADPGQIEQVILNLAVNARDAMPQGGSLVIETQNVDLDPAYARVHPGAQPGRHVMLAVSDTGHGMDRETLSHVFEPFFTTKELGKGTGLGLSTVYGIVQQSGGHVSVYSEPGRGTTLKIFLPRIDEQPVSCGARRPAEVPSGSETVLLVEDEASLREMIREVLESGGYRVLEGATARAALDRAAEHDGPIALLLTDVVMPGMNGRQVAEALTQLRPETGVLYMSGYTDDAIGHHGLLAEGTHFIQKPFTPAELLHKLRDVLDAQGTPLPGAVGIPASQERENAVFG